MSKFPIPDLRFESSFRRSLQFEARKSQAGSLATSNPDEPLPITPLVVLKVILKDTFIMPLIQGVIYSMVLLLAKPWLIKVAQNGREFGIKLFKSMGLKPSRRY
jgi:hypothetical protein